MSAPTAAAGARRRGGGWLRGWRLEVAILMLALAVRAVHLVGLAGDPLFDAPRMDARYHDEWARRIAAGELVAGEPFFRAPLYPYFLGAVYALGGGSIVVARAVQLALGALLPLVILRLGRRTLGRAAGAGAALLAAVYPLALRFEGDLLLEGPFVLLAMTALLAQIRTLERPSTRGWLTTGVLAGLAAIARPNFLAYAAVIPIAQLLARGRWLRRWREGDGKDSGDLALRTPFPPGAHSPLREALLIGAGILIPILPVTLHNAAAGDFVPIASQAGINFYIGNNPESDGYTAIAPGTQATWWGGHDDAVAAAEAALGRKLRPSEVSDYWLRQGFRFIVAQPVAAAAHFARKLYLFWWGGEISNNEHIYFLRRYSLPMRLTLWYAGVFVPFGVLAPLALVGLVLAFRRRPRAAPLVVYVLAYMGSVILFFVCARFRYPVVPVLLLLAVFAVIEIARRPRARASGAAVGAALLLAIGLNADPLTIKPALFGSQAQSYLDLGIAEMQAGEIDEALAALAEAARLDPGRPGPPAWIGLIQLKAGRYAEAETALRYAVRGDAVMFRDVVAQARKDLGRVCLRTGRYDEALREFETALSLRPEYVQAALGAGFAARDLGRVDDARRFFARALRIEPGNATARGELARLGGEGGAGGDDGDQGAGGR